MKQCCKDSAQKTAEAYEKKIPNLLANFAFNYQNEIAHADNSSDIIKLVEEYLGNNKKENGKVEG